MLNSSVRGGTPCISLLVFGAHIIGKFLLGLSEPLHRCYNRGNSVLTFQSCPASKSILLCKMKLMGLSCGRPEEEEKYDRQGPYSPLRKHSAGVCTKHTNSLQEANPISCNLP